ncbi:filamentous hemagglutinin N-terminal domain-containing protein [Methyloversatilis discipulorum]|uniref:filamentous hemagglutinin N-terminal domain-containing protein n=1 Tax=Methyloversatilis discipulorum TaxID=1119528 RepID=UPI0003A46161|nr:filamentous hemagglutinin N-terminal domain-containing protein [Methyloversatilis discipulorum]
MNKGRYRLVFSDEHRSYVPVPEETCARGKNSGGRALRRLVAAMAAALPGLVIANPTGHQIVQGQVGIQAQGSTLNITASDRAIINWKQFSIQPGETTRFIQPHSTATVLNRVVGQDPSQILGNLIANGRVFLINPNGVLFGAGAKVDTAGLVASTLNISNEDFTAGRLKFNAEGAAGKLRNEGTLKTTGGPLLLIATDIENTGLITADNGDIVLAAGKSVEIADPHQPALRVRVEAGGEAINLGQLIARGGNVGMFGAALTQAGKISATGAHRTADGRIVLRGSKSVTLTAQSETTAKTADGAGGDIDIAAPEVKIEAGALVEASGTQGGRIDIAATQKASVDGTLRATGTLPVAAAPAPAPASTAEDIELPATGSGPAPVATTSEAAGKGGHIEVTADTVLVGGTATLDASGDTGGGSVLVGGDWQGANPQVRNAQVSWIGSGARLLADALFEGDGGKVVVWADQATAFHGNIWARGGERGGNGGQVEVSGKVALLYRGRTDTSAARGRNGVLLLDPLAMVIQGGSGDGSNDGSLTFNGGAPGTLTAEALGPTVIYESEIEEQSKTTDIILRAQRSVTVGTSQFSYTGSGNAAGETAGQLTLAEGSSLLIETRNLGAGEGGASAGIDLVTGGWHGAGLRIVTQGDGSITMQTGYSNGSAVGDQRADIILPVLQAAGGGILIRAGSSSTVDLRGSSYNSGAGIEIEAGTVTGGVTFNAADGTHIDGDYSASSGTLTFNGAASSISGRLTLAANLGGNSALTLGDLLWQGGQMLSGATTTLTGSGLIDNSAAYRYLDRRLDVTGQLEFANSAGYDLYVRDGGRLNISAGGSVGTASANGFLRLTASAGTATFSAESGASLSLGDGSTFNLSSDGAAGNLIAGSFTTTGNGVLLLAAGRINTGADTTISGSGSLRLANSGVIGGSHLLTVGTLFDWRGGSMDGSGSTVLSSNGLIDNSSAYRYLQRTLRIDGRLTLDNPTGYDLRIGNGGRLHIGSTGTLATGTTNGFIYMQAGTGGTATLSADAGGRIDVADGTLLTLRSDSSSGNQLSGSFDLDGAGVLHLDSGAFNVDGNATFGGDGLLRMSGGGAINGSGTLIIASDFDWRGGRFGGSGTTRLTGDAVIDNTSAYKYVSRRIEVSGNLTFGNSTGYDLRIENGGSLHLAAGGRLSTSSSGLIYMQAGSGGNAAFSAAAGSAITVGTGTTLTLRSDGNAGNTLGGQFVLDGDGALHIDSGVFTTSATSSFGGTGLLRISGGTTLSIDHASTISTQFRFEGGTLGGSGNLLISGPMTWAGGTLAGSGTTTVSGTAVIDNTSAYKYLSRRLVIAGNLEFGNSSGYYLQINNGGTLHLGATGRLFTTAASGLIYMAAGSGGTATFSADDGARLDAASGFDMTLRSDGNSGNRIAGSFELGGSGDLHLDSGVIGTGATTRFDGSGRLRLSGGATFNANHALTIDSAFRMEGGTLGGSGNVDIGGAFTWAGGTMTGSGTTTVGGNGTIDNTSAYKYLGRRLDVTGSLVFGNTSGYYLQLNNGGHLHVAAGGSLGTSASNGLIYLASGNGGSALFSADADGDIVLGAGTELTLRADGNVGNRLAGSFDLNGEGQLHLDSGMVSVDTDSAFTGDGRLLLSGGGTLAGSAVLSIASAFDWTGGGSMSGSGTTRLLRDVTLSGSGTRILNRTLEIAAGRTLAVGDGVTLQRSASNGGSGGIVALGLFTKSAGTGTAYVHYLDISGNLSASSGILSLTGNTQGTSLGNASFSTSGSGSLRLDSGLFTLTNGQVATVSAGSLELHGATLSTAGNASIVGSGTFRQVAGTLDGAGTLTIASGFDWTGGTMAGSGTTRLATSASLSGNATRTLNRTLEIAAGHTLNLGDDVLIQRSTSNGGSGGIVALGTVSKSAGSGVAYIRYLDLRGNFTAGSGVLSIYGNTAGSSIAGAVFSSTGSARVRADSGLLTLNSGESASIGSGLFELSGATLSTSGNSAINGSGLLSFTSGSINGVGTLSVNTGFDWSSGSMGGGGVTRLNGSSRFLTTSAKTLTRTLEIAGTARTTSATSALQIQDGGRVSVLASGEFEIAGGTGFTFSGSGRIDNAGLLRKTGTAAVTLAMPLTNSGTLRVEEGVLTASAFPVNAGTLDVFNGATLIAGALQNDGVVQGSGTINLGGATLTNAGTLRPGGNGAAGTLTLTGHYAQTASGVIEADVLGTLAAEQDHLVVSGNAALDGDLRLAPANGLSFGAQDRYTVLSCGADGCLSGTFDTVDSGTLGLTATSFSNAISFATGSIASTWIAQSSGFWDVASNWAGGFIPGAQNDVVIDQAGDLTVTVRNTSPASNFVVNSLYSNENIVISGSTLTLVDDSVINGRLTMSGGTLNIGTQLETGALTLSGGTIAGGRLITAGSGSAMSGGTLSALQLMLGSQLRATGGTLSNVTLSRLGSAADAGKVLIANNGDLNIVGALTLDNAEVTLASSGNSTFLRGTSGAWSIGGNGSILFGGSHNAVRAANYLGYGSGSYSLSIGAGVTVAGSNGGHIYFGNNGSNAGTISANTAGKEILVQSWATTDTWNNSGTLRANGGILTTADTWSSSGTLRLDSGILFLGGSFNTASFNTLVRPADADRGALNLVGTLNNANSTLLLNGATGALASGGTISGGVVRINNADGGALNTGYAGFSGSSFGGSNGAALANVTLANVAGVADSGRMTIANNGDLNIVGALTLDNAEVTLASSGNSTFLRGTSGAWSIGGNGSILFGGSHNAVRAANYLGYGSGSYSLSIGAGVTVAGSNGGHIYFGNNGSNAGTISANTAGKEISLNSWASTDVWTNTGTLRLAGGRFHAGDSFISTGLLRGAGTFDASGRTLTNTGTIFAEGGVLNLSGNLVLTQDSTLRIDIGGRTRGSEYGAVDVSGGLTFGGTLQATHVNGFTPGSTEAFRVLRFGSRVGSSQFASLDVPAGFGYGSYYGNGNFLLGVGSALTGINEWISNASGDWATGTNWSLGVAPNDPTQTVIADRVGVTPTITISSGDWSVGSLLSEENLTMSGGTLTVAGLTRVTGSLTLNGSSRLTAQGPLDLDLITLNSSSQFVANTAGHIASFVQNNGTSTFAGAGLAFDAIDIRGGTVNYNAALALPSSLLRVAGHTANLNADQGQTRIEVVSGTLNLNLSSLSSDVALSGGTLNVAGSTAASGDFDWTGGNIGGGGTFTLSGVLNVGGGSNSFGLNDTTLVHTNASGNSRIAKTGGYFYLSGTSELRNAAGAVLTVDTSGGNFGTYYSSGAGGTLHNQGTLNKTGSGALYIYNPTRLQQAGQLNLQQGSIIVQGGSGHLLSGNTALADGTALQLTGSHTSTISATARFSGDGQLLHESGTLTLADGARIDVAYTQASGTLSLTGSATMNDDFIWNSGTVRAADLATAGTLTLNGAFIQSGNTTVYLRDGLQMLHTNTAGDSRIANASSSGFNVENGAVFRNTGVLTLDTAGAGSIMYIDHDAGSGGRFENAGTLVKSGDGRVDFGSYGSLAFNQSGSFAVNAGTVEFGGTSIALGGSMAIADGARVLVRAGSTTTASGFAVNGNGVLAVGGGTLVLGHGTTVAADVELSSGTLSIGSANAAEVTGDLSWTGGTINGGGTLTQRGRFLQTGNTTVYLRDGTLLDHVNVSGDSRIANTSASGFNLENGAVFRNSGVLRLDVAGSSSVMYIDHDSGSAGSFVNTGTLIKSGSGRLDFGSFGLAALTQNGTLQIEQGRVTLGVISTTAPAHLLAGQHVIGANGSLEIVAAPGTTVTANAAAAATFSGSGPLMISGGTLMLADGLDLGITVRQSGGYLAGSGDNALTGRYEWTGGDVSGSGTLTVSGVLQLSGGNSFGLNGRSMVHTNASGNSSLYKPGGYFYLGGNATFTNAAGATLYIDTASNTNGGAWYQSGSAGSFVNAGTLVKQGNGTFNFWSPIRFVNTGSFTVAQGAVMADGFTNNPGVLQLLSGTSFSTSGSALTSTGTIAGHGTLIVGSTGLLNRGVVAPGGADTVGTLRITGQYVQGADGTLQIERGSAGTDALIVSGAATLGGTLAVTQLAGYQPAALQTDIVSANTLSGSFASVTLPSGYSTLTVGNRHVLSYAGAICGGVCWDGGAGTLLWTDAANWTTDLLPGTTDLVFIDLENGVNVQLTGGTHTIASLTTTVGNTLTLSGGALTLSGGTSGQAASALAGDLVIGGGSFTANAQTSIARLLLSAGSFGGSGAVTFTGAGSSWTGGDMVGSGSSIFAAGSTFEYAAGTRSSTRRVDVRQGATVRNASGSMTLTGGASNAGVIDVALGATVRYGGSASYLLDTTGQFDGGGRIEFIDSAMATAASTAPAIADGSFTVRVQDAARFTMTAPTSIANLELAGNGLVTAQAGFQAATVTQTGGTLTVNAASAIGRYNWNGGTFAGSGSATLTGQSSWTRGTLTGNLVIANGATLTLSTTGSDDVQGTSYKRFGAGSLSNFGTLAWQEGHIDVVGNARVDNAGLIAISGNYSFGDRSVGVGTLTLNNLASGTINKSGGGETSIGTLGIPGGTANYAVVTNNGRINVASGSLRFGIGYAGAPGGGSFTHNGEIDVFAGALLEFGGSLTHNGSTFIDSGATLRRIGGFTNAASGLLEGFGTLDVGAGNTLRNDGTLHVGDLFNNVYTHGTMRVTGNYVQGSGGRLLMAVGGNAAGEYDQLAVNGSATLGGALVVSEAPGYVRETVAIDLITTGAGVSNSFATVTLPDAGYATSIAGNALRLSYNALVCGGICWDGGAGTNLWTDAANWTGDVLPGVNDLVFIALGGGSSVLLNSGSHTIAGLNTSAGNHLTINGASLTLASLDSTLGGNLTLGGGARVTLGSDVAVDFGGALNWTSAATLAGGTLNLLGGSTATLNANTNGGHLTLSGITINNAGTVNYASEGRQLLINDGTTFNNSGRFNFTTDGDVTENSGFGGNFNNSGTVAKTGGSGNSAFTSFVRFNNLDGGTVDSGTGSLLLQTGGDHAGAFNIVGSNVRFNGGAHTFATGSTLNGIANFGGATVNLSGATVDGQLNLQGGTINQAAGTALNVDGAMRWDASATISGGTLNLLAGSSTTLRAHTNGGHLTLSGVTVNNMGTVNYASEGRQLLINDGTTFNNSGRFNFTTDGDVTENSGFGGNFNNSGTLAKTGGSGSSGFASFVRFNNLDGGTVDSGTGSLLLQTGGNHAGVFNIVGSNVRFNAGTHTFATGATLNGIANFGGATVNLSGARIQGALNLSGGTLNLARNSALDIAGTMNWDSAASISGGGELNLLAGTIATLRAHTNGGHLTLSGVTVNNMGTVNYASEGRQLLINDSTTFNNSGRFNFTTDGDITENSGSGGNLNNSGTIAKTSGTGRSGFASFVRLVDQGGSYRADSGTLDLSALSTLSGRMDIAAGARIVTGALSNGGIIAGNGTLDLGGALLTNRGVLQPGGAGTVGTLTVIGGLQQDELGRIEAEFAGTAAGQYDVLDVRGNTLLDGVLAIQAINGAQPSQSMGLAMVTAGGTLEASSLALSAPSGNYSLTRTASTVRLGFTNCAIGICWDGGAGTSNWLDAANWTGDVLPGLNDLVFINLAGGADVVLNANPALTLAGLTIGDANALTLTGGTLNAPTTILNGGTLSLTGGTLNFGAALNNAGTLNYAGGTLTGNLFTNNGTLNVLPGSSGNLTTTRLNNTGSIVVDANRTVEFGSGGGMIFANDGNVQVRSGTLSVLAHDTDLSGPGADSGDYTVNAGATLRFRDAFRDFGPGSSITGGGDVEFTAFSGGLFNVNGVYSVGGTTRVSGNTLVNFNSNASFGTLDLAGNIGGTGSLTVAENLVWTSGSIGGAGRSVIVNGDALLDGASLNLAGARLTIADSGLIDAGTRLNMSSGAQLIVASGASLGVGSNAAVGGSGSLVNRGTLEGTVGGGSSNIGVLLSNFGEVSASSGNLGLTGGIANTGAGSFVIGADATMELGGDLPPDIFDRIGGAGTLSFSPTSQPVINRSYAAQGGTPFSFSLRSGAVLTGLPQNGTVSGEAAGWIYTANAGFNGTDSARFTLSLGSGTAVFNISFAVTSEPAVTQPQVQVIATTLLPEVFQPPRIVLPSTPPQISAPINVASVDALSDIATASGPQFDQPLRDFRASRLQCR